MFYDLPLRKNEFLKLKPKAENCKRNILVCPTTMQQQVTKQTKLCIFAPYFLLPHYSYV